MNFTTIEQSKALIEAGINPNTADMCYTNESYKGFAYTNGEYKILASPYQNVRKKYEEVKRKYLQNSILAWDLIPCWSTGALIELLPRKIWLSKKDYSLHYWIKMYIYEKNNRALYQIAYGNSCNHKTEWCDKFSSSKNENIVDALIDMILWLLKYDFI